MQVLITGGGGYLGSVLSRLLLEQGHHVSILDRFCFGTDSVAELQDHPNCTIHTGDIRRFHEIEHLFEGVDAVIHLAALANDPSCDLNDEMTRDVNVESAVELARQAMEAGVSRFILGSSCLVYGQGVFEWLDEQSPPNPVSLFARSKLAAEEGVLSLNESGFCPVVTRMATLFGWSPRMRFDLAVNQMVASAVTQGRIEVRGGGNQWRPFIHVKDAAAAMIALLEAPEKLVSGEVLNIGDDALNLRVSDLAEKVAAHFSNVQVERIIDDDDRRNFRVSFEKIKRQLGFASEQSLDMGIREVAEQIPGLEAEPFNEQYFNVLRMKHLLDTPVDEGGEPVAARFIPLSKPTLGEEEEVAIAQAFRSGWLTSGPQVQAFEQDFGKLVNSPCSIGVSSCTAALHLSLIEAGVQPGDEVITSPITWASTANTITHMGAKMRLVDVEPETLNIDVNQLEAALSERTKVIMPVHMAGHPCDLDAIYDIAGCHGIRVIEDAAHGLGAHYKGKPVGSHGAATCFSFYAIKNLTTIEGGMVAIDNEERAEQIRLMAHNGMSATAWERYGRSSVVGPAQVITPGFKYGLSNISAAIGLAQLKKFSAFMAARKRLAGMYQSALAGIDEIELPYVAPYADPAWHLFVIRLKLERLTMTRDEIAQALRCENVGSGVHFYGIHLHPWYKERLNIDPEQLPEATRASHEILSLPLYPQMTERHVQEVVCALKKVLYHGSRK